MNHRSASGQILVLVLLVVLVALTIGLSIASRTLSTLRNTAELDQSNRAFSAAEAGIERALAMLKSDANACQSTDCSATISGIDAKVQVTDAGGTTNSFGVSNVEKDGVMQANLDAFSGGTIDLFWGNRGDNAGATCPNSAAIVVTFVYRHTATGAYGMGKDAYDGWLDASRQQNNFKRAGVTVDPTDVLTLQANETKSDYGYKVTLNVAPGGPFVSAGSQAVLVR